MVAPELGKTYAFRIFGGGYGAVQVIAEKPWVKKQRLLLLLRLNFEGAEPPCLEDVRHADAAPPLFKRNDAWLWTSEDFAPWWAHELGELPLRTPVIETSLGRWEQVRTYARRALRYAGGAPKPNPYRARREAPSVRIDLGGAVEEHPSSCSNLATGPLLPAAGDVKWSGLTALPNLFALRHEGADRGLIAAIPNLPVLERLHWSAPGEPVLDLRRTRLDDIALVGVERPIEIWLPEGCARLLLDGRYDLATIHAPDTGEGFDLTLRGAFVRLPRGLERVQEATFFNSNRIDCAALRGWPELKSLRILGSATRLDNAGALGDLPHLCHFGGTQLYHFDAGQFPTGDNLYDVAIEGLRAEDARILRKRLKHLPRAAFTKTRSEKWIAENLDNPFRDWDVDGPAFGKAAMKLWRDAVQAAQAEVAPVSAQKAKTVVLTLVEGLNALAQRYEIDTLRREQACEAIGALVQKHLNGALSSTETQETIDEARDW